MIDIYHNIGSDLSVGPTGDLALASPLTTGQQRVLRRLLTNPGNYIWNLGYGGGLGSMVGNPSDQPFIAAVVNSQMSKEDAVSHDPPPSVSINADAVGNVTVSIKYVDSGTGQTNTVSIGA